MLFNRFMQPKLYTCLRYDLIKSAGAKLTMLKVQRLDLGKLTERVASYRLPIVVKAGVIYSDYIYLGRGRMQVYVNVIAPASREAQLRGFELRLAKLIVGRTSAQAR